jgi:hypothetical protein
VKRVDKTHRMKRMGGKTAHAGTRILLVPAHIASLIPDDTEFKPELTDDGLLYRVVKPGTPATLPEWAR